MKPPVRLTLIRPPFRPTALLAALLLALLLAGCSAAGAERLYALPRLTGEYVRLEELIDGYVSGGGEYAAPQGGAHRQSVQLRDLDGDGVSEAVAFLADSAHTPVVCVYRLGETGDYELFGEIEGAGGAVGSVEYADLTGDGAEELALLWQLSGDVRLLAVYSVGGTGVTQLMSADCSAFFVSDLDGDGRSELLDLALDDASGTLTLYVFDEHGKAESSAASLSAGITDVLRARVGYLSDGAAALFIESSWQDGELITDVFTAGSAGLANITLGAGGRSGTLRAAGAFASDINADRVMELPEASGVLFNWYSLDSLGRRTLALTTYHDYDDGWYLALPDSFLDGSLRVTTDDALAGETETTFSLGGEDVLTIYTLTGENRLDRAGEDGRVLLAESGATVYAAAITAPDTVTAEDVAASFRLIYAEWQTGDL